MKTFLKRSTLIAGAAVWFAAAVLLSVLLLQSVGLGADLRVVALSVSGSAFLGLIHFTGFAAAAVLSFTIGVVLLLRAFAPQKS